MGEDAWAKVGDGLELVGKKGHPGTWGLLERN